MMTKFVKKVFGAKLCVLLLCITFLLPLFGCNGNMLEQAARDLNEYSIVCSLDLANKCLSAVQTVSYTHKDSEPISELRFNVYANVYSADSPYAAVPQEDKLAAYPNGYSYGGVRFDGVQVDGADVPFVLEDGIVLSVPIKDGLYEGESAEITLTYEVRLANVLHRTGWGENTVNLGNCFPTLCVIEAGQFRNDGYYAIGDPFYSDCANYDFTVTAPQDVIIAASAPLTSSLVDGMAVYSGQVKAVRDFALTVSPNYETLSLQSGDTRINYYYFDDENAQQTALLCAKAVEFFGKLLCPYPYASLSICQADFCYGGMEYPCLVTVSVKKTSDGEEQSADRQGYAETIVHELAHQWVYGIVGNDQINDAFMDEGLAEYLTYRFFESNDNFGVDADLLMSNTYANYVTYLDVMSSHLPEVDTAMKPLGEYETSRQYVLTTYIKGCIMFFELEKLIGRSKTDKALRSYVQDNAFGLASRQDLYDAFSDACGWSQDQWFCSVVDGKDLLLVPKS